MSVKQMLDEIDPIELTEWRFHDRVEGLPTERLIRKLALMFAVLCNCICPGSKVTPEMFLKEKKFRPANQSAKAQIAVAMQIAAAHNASQQRGA